MLALFLPDKRPFDLNAQFNLLETIVMCAARGPPHYTVGQMAVRNAVKAYIVFLGAISNVHTAGGPGPAPAPAPIVDSTLPVLDNLV